MKILIVDDEHEIVQSLHNLIAASGEQEVFGASSGEEALQLVQTLGGVDLLITDVIMDGIDGFVLREALLANHPMLQTIFITGYDLSEYTSHASGNKIFNKPLNTAEILAAVEQANQTLRTSEYEREDAAAAVGQQEGGAKAANLAHVMKQGFTGKLDQFQLLDIIQMCCLSRRSGRLRLAKGVEKAVLFLQEGRIVHAISGSVEAEEAVYKVIAWDFGEFSFDEGLQPPKVSIQSGWEHVIMEGVRRRDETHGDSQAAADQGLEGKSIGDYQITRKLGEGEWGDVYEATQISVQRPVALKVLKQDALLDPQSVQKFIADASAKANVQHPSILSVYEAGEANGFYYYARELVDGYTLADLIAQGSSLSDQLALQVIRIVSEALSYLNHFKVPHSEIEASSIFIGNDQRPRIANIAQVGGEQTIAVQREIKTLSGIVSAAMQEGAAASAEVRSLLTKMKIDGSGGFLSWGALIQTVRNLEPQVVPKDAYKLSAQDEAAIRAVEAEKLRQRRSMILSTIGMITLFWIVGVVVYFKVFRNAATDFSSLVEVPAGEFIYQDGEKRTLPTFYISQYEVSIGMYERFLKHLEKNPTTEYDHEKQPKGKSHKPFKWDLMIMAARKKSVTFEGYHLELDHPVFNLDWYDAYAYAKWKGHRLPTEEEWEKAARGTKGNLYPWGNEFEAKGVNSAIDFSQNPTITGSVDGYNRWAEVDETKQDRSPFDVYNMAGNVSEWTGSWDKNPDNTSEVLPVIRGGSYNSTLPDGSPDVLLTRRIVVLLPEQGDTRVGFRTVSDTAPEK